MIVEAVAHHHHLERVACDKLDLPATVYFANWLAHDHQVTRLGAASLPNASLHQEIVAKLGVEKLLPDWRSATESAALELSGVSHGK